MKKNLLLLILMTLFSFNLAKAQYFSITEVDTSNFPKVSASFLALKADGNSYTELNTEDFSITENGVYIPHELYELDCGYPPISVVLVVDQSNSMKEVVEGEIKWEWVVNGVQSFISSINLSDSISKVSIIGFGGRAYMHCPFTGNKDALLDSLDKMNVLNATTNFNEPFLDQTVGAIKLLKNRPYDQRRVIVFLSDGKHETSTAVLRDEEIITQLKESNIQTYAITLLDDMNPDLNNIAERSGGGYYQIMNKYELSKIYSFIANDAQGKMQCILSWPSELSCAEVASFRKAKIEFLKIGAIKYREYKAPNWSIVDVAQDKPIYDLGDPDPGNSTYDVIEITPDMYPFNITDIEIIPNDYFDVDWGEGYGRTFSGNLLIDQNETKSFNIRFTQQGSKSFRQATLVLDGEPCPKEIPLIGGKPNLKVTQPSEGDIFSSCDNITIKWEGNDSDERVNLYYNSNNGPWFLIKNNVAGNSYTWTPPPINGKIKIRAQIVTQSLYKWAVSDGGEADENVATISIQDNDLYAVICGTNNGISTINGEELESFGENDAFLAKYDTEGNILWAQTAGSTMDDNAIAAYLDPVGDIYMSGLTYKGAQFDRIFPPAQYANLPYIYLAKYSPTGDILGVTTFGGKGRYDEIEVYPVRMSYEFDYVTLPKIVVEGRYKGYFQDEDEDWLLPTANYFKKFFIVFDYNLNIINLTADDVEMTNIVGATDFDSQGNRFQTGNFADTKKFGSYTVTSNAGQDYYITKYGQTNTSVDVSDEFDLNVPSLRFESDIYNVGNCLVGDTCLKTVQKYLINDGKFDVKILEATIGGPSPNEFAMVTDLKDSVIAAGDTINFDVHFQPDGIGFRSAILFLNLECISNIQLTLEGEGVCDAVYEKVVDFGNVYLGKKDTIIYNCIFQNPTSMDIKIQPYVTGTDWTDFKIFRMQDGKVLTNQSGYLTIEPDSCLELLVEFTPKDFGVRTAFIDYKMPVGCEEVITELIGEGVDAELMADEIDWKYRRVRSDNDSICVIKNEGTIAETITNIQLEDQSLNNNFFLENSGDVSIPIDGDSEYELGVTFVPTDEIYYETNIIITIANKTEPLIVPLKGTGYLPKLESDYSCGDAINAGETTTASIVINNPSTSSELKINRIYITEGQNEYSWSTGSAPQDIIVGINDSKIFDLDYSPINGESHNGEVIVEADNYDGTFDDLWKENPIKLDCDAYDVTYNDPVTFENILICNTAENFINITNNSVSTKLTVYGSQMIITGTNKDNFEIGLTDDIDIDANSTYELPVSFKPDQINKISYSATVSIPTSFGIDIVVQLEGTSDDFMISASKASYILEPGKSFTLPVNIEIPSLNESSDVNNGNLTKAIIQLTFDYDMLKYKPNSLANNVTNWEWAEPVELQPGTLEIVGTGSLPLPYDDEAFEIDFQVLLGLNDSTEIIGNIQYECANEEVFLTLLKYDEFCFDEGRKIIPRQNYSTTIANNIKTQQIELEMFLSNDAPTKIEMFNSMGQKMQLVENSYLESGHYSYQIDYNDISSGIYFINISSGPYTTTKSVVIIK